MQFDLFRFVLQCYQFLIVLISNKNSENCIIFDVPQQLFILVYTSYINYKLGPKCINFWDKIEQHQLFFINII